MAETGYWQLFPSFRSSLAFFRGDDIKLSGYVHGCAYVYILFLKSVATSNVQRNTGVEILYENLE